MHRSLAQRWFTAAILLALIVAGLIYVAPRPTADEVFKRGVTALLRHDIVEAERVAQQLRHTPNAEQLERVLNGGILAQTGMFREALSELDAEVTAGTQREFALLWIAESYYGLKDLARAEIVLRSVLKEFPNNEQAVRIIAAVYYDLGAMHPALEQLEKLKKSDPQDFGSYHMAGAIYLDFEQFDEAIVNLQAALDRDPPANKRNEIALDLAVANRKLLKYQEALKVLESASPSVKKLAEQALCELGLGNTGNAKSHIEEAKSHRQESPDLFRAEAQLMIEQGQFEGALVVLQKLGVMEPHDFEVPYKMASVYQQLKRPMEHAAALNQFEIKQSLRRRLTELNQRANQNPYDVETRLELADTCRQLGRSDLEMIWRDAAKACRNIGMQRLRIQSPPIEVPTSAEGQ